MRCSQLFSNISSDDLIILHSQSTTTCNVYISSWHDAKVDKYTQINDLKKKKWNLSMKCLTNGSTIKWHINLSMKWIHLEETRMENFLNEILKGYKYWNNYLKLKKFLSAYFFSKDANLKIFANVVYNKIVLYYYLAAKSECITYNLFDKCRIRTTYYVKDRKYCKRKSLFEKYDTYEL